jgi:hypothetical protein
VHHAARFGDVPVNTAEVVLEIHKKLTRLAAERAH